MGYRSEGRQTDRDTIVYMEHKGTDSDRQSFRRRGREEDVVAGSQHISTFCSTSKVSPTLPPMPLSAHQKYLSARKSPTSRPESLDLEMKKISGSYKTVGIWRSRVIPQTAGWERLGNNVGGLDEGPWIFHGHFKASYKGIVHSLHQSIRYSSDEIYPNVTPLSSSYIKSNTSTKSTTDIIPNLIAHIILLTFPNILF